MEGMPGRGRVLGGWGSEVEAFAWEEETGSLLGSLTELAQGLE